MISFDDFKKCEIRIGTIISAEKVDGADKLLKIMFDFGATAVPSQTSADLTQADADITDAQPSQPVKEYTQILSGIAQYYDPSVLVGKQVPVIVNLESRTLRGLQSNGMMLAVVVDEKPILLHPDKEVPPGSLLR